MRQTKKEILEGIENIVSSKIVGNNTVKCILSTGEIIIVFHNTIIVSIKDNIYTLNSGGWRTPTTKDRINEFSPTRICQKNSLWYISGYLFYDGIQLNYKGEIINKKIIPADVENKNKELKKKINKFCALITKNNLPIPDSGDCWYCSMKAADGISWGDNIKDYDHLLNHVEEGYVHGSLLVNAMEEAGYRHHQISFHYSMKLEDTFRRSVRKYLYKRLSTLTQ